VIRRVAEVLQKSLLEQPESGMGYQFVEAEYASGQRERLLALNATYLAADWTEVQKAVAGHRSLFERHLKLAADEASLRQPPTIRSLRVTKSAAPVVREGGRKGSGPASEAPTTETTTGEEFRRFSAFENDRRVTPDAGLLPGTYATTGEDGDKVGPGNRLSSAMHSRIPPPPVTSS